MPPPEAVSVAEVPLQILPSSAVVPDVSVTAIDAVGNGFTVMVLVAVEVQPTLETVTVYVVVVVGVVVMAAVVAPVLHVYVPPPVPVIVTEAPAQVIPSFEWHRFLHWSGCFQSNCY